jgi:hypothetical protein
MRNLIESPSAMGAEQERLRSIAVKVANNNERDCDDETNDSIWRCCLIVPIRTCQPGAGAARNH